MMTLWLFTNCQAFLNRGKAIPKASVILIEWAGERTVQAVDIRCTQSGYNKSWSCRSRDSTSCNSTLDTEKDGNPMQEHIQAALPRSDLKFTRPRSWPPHSADLDLKELLSGRLTSLYTDLLHIGQLKID